MRVYVVDNMAFIALLTAIISAAMSSAFILQNCRQFNRYYLHAFSSSNEYKRTLRFMSSSDINFIDSANGDDNSNDVRSIFSETNIKTAKEVMNDNIKMEIR